MSPSGLVQKSEYFFEDALTAWFSTAILHRGLRNCFFFRSYLLFPIFIWTFISLFYLDLYFPFLFGLFSPFLFGLFFISFQFRHLFPFFPFFFQLFNFCLTLFRFFFNSFLIRSVLFWISFIFFLLLIIRYKCVINPIFLFNKISSNFLLAKGGKCLVFCYSKCCWKR